MVTVSPLTAQPVTRWVLTGCSDTRDLTWSTLDRCTGYTLPGASELGLWVLRLVDLKCAC
jgi:hypothetical protein